MLQQPRSLVLTLTSLGISLAEYSVEISFP